MRTKSGLLITMLIIVAFLFFQHRGTPTAPMPMSAVKQGTNVQIPVEMKAYDGPEEHWILTMRQSHQYFVNLYNNRKFVQQFATGVTKRSTGTGSEFGINGEVQLSGVLYRAYRLHVNRDGKSGYILLRPAQTATSGNHS